MFYVYMQQRVLESGVPDLVGIAENAVVAARSAVTNFRRAEQMVGQQTAASLAKTAEAVAASAQASLVGKQVMLVQTEILISAISVEVSRYLILQMAFGPARLVFPSQLQ